MSPEVLSPSVVGACETELARLIEEMENAPSRTALFDIGAAAEIVVLAPAGSQVEPLRNRLANAALRWMRSGLLEDLVVARVEFAYHVAMLAYLARGASSASDSDIATIRGLCEGGLIGRNEIPFLRQMLIHAYLSRSGVSLEAPRFPRAGLANVMDKRVLRARPFDEFDLHALLMCAQLAQLRYGGVQSLPRTQPLILLIEAMRSGNSNWLPVLMFLCSHFFGLPEALRSSSVTMLRTYEPADGELLPSPPLGQTDSKHIERTERGLRLRSTIAFALCLPD